MSYRFDPEFADLVEHIPSGDMSDPVASRASMKEMLGALNKDIDASALELSEQWIPGLDGAPDVKVRIYKNKSQSGITAGLLHIHGGGFVVGDIDTEHGFSVSAASKLGVVVVSVDYRLAPEDPFPAGLEDCYAALQWFHNNAEQLGVDKQRIAVAGQSAGGGLSAAVAIMAKDRGGPPICFQCLGIPEVDDRLDTPSMQQFTDTPLWNRPNAEISWKYYLGDSYTPGASNVPALAAPARVEDVAGLPPAYVTTMEFDPLRDEGVLYALKLMQGGVPVELHSYPGTFHGSSLFTHAAISKRQERDMFEVLARGLELD